MMQDSQDSGIGDSAAAERRPPGSGEPNTVLVARRLPRLAAFVVDMLLPVVVVGLLAIAGSLATGFPLLTNPVGILLFLVFVVVGAAILSSLASWLSDGQSVGKAIFGLEVRRAGSRKWDGGSRALLWAFGRATMGYAVVDCFGIGALGAATGRYRRAVHDLVFSSQVVATDPHRFAEASTFGRLVELRIREFERRRQDGLKRYEKRYGYLTTLIKWIDRIIKTTASIFAALLAWMFGTASAASAAAGAGAVGGGSTLAPATAALTQATLAVTGGVLASGVVIATTSVDSSGIQVSEGPHRFSELDWAVVDIERRPIGPGEDAEDTDPSEDFLYADIDVSSAFPQVSLGAAYQWVTLSTPDGRVLEAEAAFDRGTRDPLGLETEIRSGRTEEWTIVFTVDARDDLDGAWFEVSQLGYEPTALGGPNVLDEAARIPIAVVNPVYDGPFSRDEATVEVVDVWVSRELGTIDNGQLMDAYDYGSRRPEVGYAHLVIVFDVNCRLTGINTGGCNVSAGRVVADGTGLAGNLTGTGLDGYGSTVRHWATYPIPLGASEAVIEINGDTSGQDGTAPFEIEDLRALDSLAIGG
ncbi:RDD family protein [Agromyces sp. SYSU T00266]|uniref:RDD family protein n=1 Tax=Agromyces zhanjiangensis TaxID=3158562 RepID=UPI0033963E98